VKFKILILFLCMSLVMNTFANDSLYKSKHSIFLEIGGNTPIYSINYELQIADLPNSSFVQSIGFEIQRLDDSRDYFGICETTNQKRLSLSFFPWRCNWISHKSGKNHLELGLGATYYTASFATNAVDMVKEIKLDRRGQGIFLIPNVGYRFTPESGLLILRR